MAFSRLFSNVFSFLLARLKYALSSSDGANDLFMSISSYSYNPSNPVTRDKTVYSQLGNKPGFGHDVTMMISFDIPCSL